MLMIFYRRLISVAPPTTKPDLEELARQDGPLFEEVFFKDLNKEEVAQAFHSLGSLSIATIAKNISPSATDSRPIVYDFGG